MNNLTATFVLMLLAMIARGLAAPCVSPADNSTNTAITNSTTTNTTNNTTAVSTNITVLQERAEKGTIMIYQEIRGLQNYTVRYYTYHNIGYWHICSSHFMVQLTNGVL